jgi:colanic acid biosynthesis glycosyl transferase WcaI
MGVLIISQAFWPDTASVAQHMTDLAKEILASGHPVDVLSSRNDYEQHHIKYPASEMHEGIRIQRIANTGFGKKRVIGRLTDFFTFNFLLFFRLLGIRKNNYQLVLCTTSPPLVAYIALRLSKQKKIPFCYWTMDLQPELSIASGLIRKGSPSAHFLTRMGNYIIRHSDCRITLDKYMKEHLVERGAEEKNTHIVPVWPVMEAIYDGARLDNPFRRDNDFGDRIVVMYSGNHSFVHPLDNLLDAALELKNERRLLFVFIGEGVRKKEVTAFKLKHGLDNILQLPFQPRSNIHLSLGAGDIQVVIMGEGQVGFTHPNKIYGAMFIGRPILYIGPSPSHISDILRDLPGNILVSHGQQHKLKEELLHFAKLSETERELIGRNNQQYAEAHFSPEVLKKAMLDILSQEIKGDRPPGANRKLNN